MYNDRDLLGKEVIDAAGEVLGKVLEVTVKDDVPCMVVGPKKFLASKETIAKSGAVHEIPYYTIESVDDTIILKDEISEIEGL